MFPNRYPGNLDCEWRILAEEGQQVQITFHSVATERNFDVVQVIDGPCWDGSNVMATISGKQAKKQLDVFGTLQCKGPRASNALRFHV